MLIVQSGLLRILDLVKTAPLQSKLDEISLLLAIKVYLVNSPCDMVSSANIKYPCINAFSSSLQSANKLVQISAVKILTEIIREANINISAPYIQSTAPQIIKLCLGQKLNHPQDQDDLKLALESIIFTETMLETVSPEQKSQMLKLHIPILINFLLDSQTDNNPNQLRRLLHESSLTRLTKLGGKFPEDFKVILNSNTDMRKRVERAVIENAERQKQKNISSQQTQSGPVQPSITLKTDFSNFK